MRARSYAGRCSNLRRATLGPPGSVPLSTACHPRTASAKDAFRVSGGGVGFGTATKAACSRAGSLPGEMDDRSVTCRTCCPYAAPRSAGHGRHRAALERSVSCGCRDSPADTGLDRQRPGVGSAGTVGELRLQSRRPREGLPDVRVSSRAALPAFCGTPARVARPRAALLSSVSPAREFGLSSASRAADDASSLQPSRAPLPCQQRAALSHVHLDQQSS